MWVDTWIQSPQYQNSCEKGAEEFDNVGRAGNITDVVGNSSNHKSMRLVTGSMNRTTMHPVVYIYS